MKNFITLCVKRPVTVVMTILSIIIGGIVCAVKLPFDKLPEISSTRITVETAYTGMSAEDVRTIVTIPVEDALSPVKGLERMRSISRDGSSLVTLDFRFGTDQDSASVLVREAVDMVYPTLPEGAQKPLVRNSANDDAQIIIAVSSKYSNSVFERRFADYELRSRLRSIDGAGNIIITGGRIREAQIKIDVLKAAQSKMNPANFAQMIAAETQNIPAGSAKDGERELVVISKGRPNSIRELSEIIVPLGSAPVKISDIGELKEGTAKQKSIFVYNGKEQTALEIYRRAGANPIQLSRDVRKVISDANNIFSRDVEIVVVYDETPSIIDSLQSLGVSTLMGGVAVIVILFFFIKNLRVSLLAALSIPVSASFVIIMLFVFGRSINSMSLSGIALGLGLVSDTSVIMLDVLCRNFNKLLRKPYAVDVAKAAAGISASSFAGAATTAVVFVPIMFLQGPLGELFGDLSIAIVTSVITGWLFAQFVVPSLFVLFYKLNYGKKDIDINSIKYVCFYKKLLNFSLGSPKRVICGAVFLSLIGFFLIISRPAVFVTTDSASELITKIKFPIGTTLETVLKESIPLANKLKDLSCLENLYAMAGAEDEDGAKRASEDYQKEELIFRCFIKKGIKPELALVEVKNIVDGFATGSKFNILAEVEFPPDKTERAIGLSSSEKLAFKSNDIKKSEIDAVLKKINAVSNGTFAALNVTPYGKIEEYRIYPKRELAALLGISSVDIANIVYSSTEGISASSFEVDGYPMDVRVLGKGNSFDAKEIEKLPVALTENSLIFLGSAAGIVREETLPAIARLDRSDVQYILPVKYSANKIQNVINNILKEMPELIRIDESAFARYKTSLIVTVLLVIALLYLTIAAQFESFILPLIFMLSIPFALAGAGPALFFAGCSLDCGAVLALLVLFGLVVNNGMVFYETSLEKINSGIPVEKAVADGAAERLRPVLATTLTTIIVLLPMSLGTAQKSMSIAMLGGCVAGTVLTLFVLPPVFKSFLSKTCVKGKNN
jgi:multidrug efflux pump subunit AcrB